MTTKNDEKSALVLFDVVGMLGSAGSIVFALSCAPANFQAYISTEKKSQNVVAWTWVTGGAVILGAIMCMIMGICGYLSFRDNTDGEILNNFPQRGFDFFKVMIVAHLILYIPVNFIIMRYSMVRMWCDKKSEDLMTWSHVTVTLCLLAFITGIVLILIAIGFANGTGFSIILTLTGGIAGSSLTFIVPAALYLREKPSNGRWTVMAWACGLFGFAVMITVVTITLMQYS